MIYEWLKRAGIRSLVLVFLGGKNLFVSAPLQRSERASGVLLPPPVSLGSSKRHGFLSLIQNPNL